MSAVIYVSYPRGEDITFDLDYYINTHMQLAQKHWGPYGLKSWAVVEFEKGDPSGLNVQAVLQWTTKEDFEKCLSLAIPEVHEDLKHYTNGTPVIWFAKNVLQYNGN